MLAFWHFERNTEVSLSKMRDWQEGSTTYPAQSVGKVPGRSSRALLSKEEAAILYTQNRRSLPVT